MSTLLSPDNLRTAFKELGAKREAIIAKTKPLRDRYDALRAEQDRIGEQMKSVAAEFKAIEKAEGLYDIDVQRGQIVKLLGGRTG